MIASCLVLSTKHTNKCKKLDFVTEKIGQELGAVRRATTALSPPRGHVRNSSAVASEAGWPSYLKDTPSGPFGTVQSSLQGWKGRPGTVRNRPDAAPVPHKANHLTARRDSSRVQQTWPCSGRVWAVPCRAVLGKTPAKRRLLSRSVVSTLSSIPSGQTTSHGVDELVLFPNVAL